MEDMDISEPKLEIDDSLYSRQRYVLGDEAMRQMAQSVVYLSGLNGVGVEIAKNLVLAGIKNLIIQDGTQCQTKDLGSQFFISENDVKERKTRAQASLAYLSELNPYVDVTLLDGDLNIDNLSSLQNYQCILLCDSRLDIQLTVNEFARANGIKFISADVYGVVGSLFCDFGDDFNIVDATGEEARDIFIGSISQGNPGIVKVHDERLHGLESGDIIKIREVLGMSELNGLECVVEVLSPITFSIGDTSSMSAYTGGGIFRRVPQQKRLVFKSLRQQLKTPDLLTPDLGRFDAPAQLHKLYLGLHAFHALKGRFPAAGHPEEAAVVARLAAEAATEAGSPEDATDDSLLSRLAAVASGCLTPLCAFIGGAAAQETLKALTGKFTPLHQWFLLDCRDLLPEEVLEETVKVDDRNQLLRLCLGTTAMERLHKTKLFMVGCGAIGCEMLKNLALLGVATGANGVITVTDNDLIEKSNLNRQFLFRPHHIQKPKSVVAADAAKKINPQIRILPHQHKVCHATERTMFHDSFFQEQDICVNALDNLEARRYMDQRCVLNSRALLESGTLGTKGHVQTIVPHLTEPYGAQSDPHEEEEVPYCTLKSFPTTIEHCIEWARDKFESSFAQKPALFNKFWASNSPAATADALASGEPPDGSVAAARFVKQRPLDWPQCLTLARCKFEKYFNHRARNLMHAFPLDTKMADGSPFWSMPKRPPRPITFDPENSTHALYVWSCARLYAAAAGVTPPAETEPPSGPAWTNLMAGMAVPEFKPSGKKIVTDETVSRKESDKSTGDDTDDMYEVLASGVRTTAARPEAAILFGPVHPVEFEKDDDSNSHIDYITAASNLRAEMYSLEPADRLKVKLLAGRIVPAIATTTAAVAGLVSLELLKLVCHPERYSVELFRNAFLNLALPLVVLSEPGPAVRERINDRLSYTAWDRWEVGPPSAGLDKYTVQDFLTEVRGKYGLTPSMVVQGVRMVYVPMMPPHRKRLTKPMSEFLRFNAGDKYVDLVLTFEDDNDCDGTAGPPLRLMLS